MKTLTTLSLQIAIATTLFGGLAACGDKPPATATTAAPAAAPAPNEPAGTPPPQNEPSKSSDQAPTARELAAAPRGSGSPPQAESAAPPPVSATSAEAAAPRAAAPAAPANAPRYANVISVQPIKRKVDHKREVCRDERVVHRARPKDEHQVAGTVIGAIAGGVIGNQVGGGRGRDLATVAGAVGGGYAGKKIQQGQQNKNTYTTTERRCREVNEPSEEVVAYDVVYEYLGSTQKVRLDHDPGDRVELPVRGIE
ncbi:glycine zipper 2TM domain-containing protein [Dokdonella sp.]|uniref:glycine zipper 2TM domain-containing protein n=1 Tax=Dokdonella sp. TaxID=2291710 RepID=UPI001B1839BF|nr:glycine zipper 2TM domain-containing protein [Dokdonella sp.]MBO9661803.1 glycine zipper 2TM domain-containing protein [Dokdonella sp.]